MLMRTPEFKSVRYFPKAEGILSLMNESVTVSLSTLDCTWKYHRFTVSASAIFFFISLAKLSPSVEPHSWCGKYNDT